MKARHLLALLFLASGGALAQDAATPAAAGEAAAVRLDEQRELLPGDGPGWKLRDKASGKEKPLILPAFHPEFSVPAVEGNRMAYIGRTQNKGRQQLGCITFDLDTGKVLNRQVSDVYAREGEKLESPRFDPEKRTATCALAGERCSGKNLEHCEGATEHVVLDFAPGSLARKDLRASGKGRKGAHARGAKGAKGKAASGKARSKAAAKPAGKTAKAGKSAKSAKAGPAKSKHKH